MSAWFLVQVRNTGESWTTVNRFVEKDPAVAAADMLAARRQYVGLPEKHIPEHEYVRVVFRGSAVYNPRLVTA